ncbi:hypothetical protein CHLRE_06g272500v5 [Chlamydomonas reinhardtii]|uniref:Uncharacterized protein n=1 Tax=Chlamydomonas reinhardtii TaxID=3055 RepID=A8HVR4_CHLRE|nr:uncharacterized protein CHLRE_06g272500v5 [Chlamydomonas reinhardtii]PNW82070.1 hypothetical protein CHLRE_06g272500v5 [Chlamydomonas reinhardtii]|eukprot:XP_001696478.1 predicted protein [Chlamydomonas reinhardtii]
MLRVHTIPFSAVSRTSSSARPVVIGRQQIKAAPVAVRRSSFRCWAASPETPAGAPAEEFQGLLPDEDAEVPGNYFDAMDPKTKLGKAVRAAVDELNHLNAMELENLQKADSLLKKLGLKSSIFQVPEGQKAEESQ